MKLLHIVIIIFLLFFSINSGQNMKLNVIPKPQLTEKIKNSSFKLREVITISGVLNNELKYSADEIQETLSKLFKIKTKIRSQIKSSDIRFILAKKYPDNIKISKKILNESYYLNIDRNSITITAITAKGIYYGSMTLLQLLEHSKNKRLNGLKIIDWSDTKIRGISDDISRGQVSTLKNFKRIIKFISRYKMNTYMPYMEDMFRFSSFPSIGKGRGALTKTEVKEIVKYAKKHFVEVIPIFQTLGHYENILTQNKFLKYAEFPGAASLNISSENTYKFLNKLLPEIFNAFPSEYFHMGADESYDVGLGKSKSLVDSIGIAEAHLKHYLRVYNICKQHGKKVMMYGDILLKYPEIIKKLPKDITIVNWRYHPRFEYPSVLPFKDAGLNYIVSPSVWNFVNTFPNYEYANTNIKNITYSGLQNNAIGMINSNWGDFGAETLKELVLYGYAWSAQCSWNYSDSNIKEFNTDYFNDFWGIEDTALPEFYEKLSDVSALVFWNNVWMHPLTKRKYQAWWDIKMASAAKAYWIEQNLSTLRKKIAYYKNKVTRNIDHLDILDFEIKFDEWYALKLKTVEKLKYILTNQDTDTLKSIDLINENIKKLLELKKEHSTLWKRYYKKANLNMVMDKYNRLIEYFEETKEQLKNGKLESPLIKSEWIYYPNPDSTKGKYVTFSKKFNIQAEIKSAKLQIIADTYAKLFINGKYVTRVLAKRTGSLWVEHKRIKMIDISKFLKNGENVITVEAKNFIPNANAGINIDAQIITNNDTLEIQSDETWLVSSYGDKNQLPAVPGNYSLNVIAPNFKTGRTSWIER